jgi:heterodisulfide reductase subunit B
MKYALFLGCTIPARLIQYELSTRAVLERLKVELVDIKEFNCCGYPLANTDFKASILAASRNLALAEKRNLDILVLCKCGFGMLKKAAHLLEESPALKKEINDILEKEGLSYEGTTEIKHLLSVLYHDIGIEAIGESITTPFSQLKIATHYGCHALRPSNILKFDDPVNPTLFDKLVEATGAKSVSWQAKLDCCGAPLFGVNDELSMDLTEKKLLSAHESGADLLCTACPYCQIQFDTVQRMIKTNRRRENPLLAPILYTQLLGLSLGIQDKTLGLDMNGVDVGVACKFSQVTDGT